MADPAPLGATSELEQLHARVRELEIERRHLLTIIEILEEISGTLHFTDIMAAITQKLGQTFGLDRCSIFLTDRGATTARLVASYEDPSIRNHVVDLDRYPEVKRALTANEVVFIPDAQSAPLLMHIRGHLAARRVRSITVVPITWRAVAIGALFLRTFQDGPQFSETDLKFCQVIASLTAKALRNAYRYDRLRQRQSSESEQANRADRERIALLGFIRRLLTAASAKDGAWGEAQLARISGEELDRLVEIAMTVVGEEAKGT